MNSNYSFFQPLTKLMVISLLVAFWVFMGTSASAGTTNCTQHTLILDQSDTENNEAASADNEEEDEEDEEPECD